MALLGVLARIDSSQRTRVERDLTQLPGVSLFSVDDQHRVGLLVECASLDASHTLLREQIEKLPGVLGAWPVFSYAGDPCGEQIGPPSPDAGEPSSGK